VSRDGYLELTTLPGSESDRISSVVQINPHRYADNNIPASSVGLVDEHSRTSINADDAR
jgi:hypothetical protein